MNKWRWLALILTALGIFWWCPSFVEAWLTKRLIPANLAWEVKSKSNPSRVAANPEGQIFLAGSRVVKLDGKSGHELWEQHIGYRQLSVFNGDIYLAGSETKGYRPGPIAPPFSGPDTDFALAKISGKDGVKSWQSSFDGGHKDTDWAEKLVITSDGNPVAAGFTPDDTHYFGCVAKVDARDGRVIWQYRTNEASVELWHGSLGLVAGEMDDVFFGSSRKSKEPGSSQISFWITKLHGENGRPLWTAEFPSSPPESHMLTHLAKIPGGDLIAVGYHAKQRGRNLVFARFSGNDGRLVWSGEQDADTHETIEPTSLVVDGEGRVFVGARSWNGSATMPLFDRWVLSLSVNDGHRVWANREAGKSALQAAGEICSTPKLIIGTNDELVCVGSVWNGNNVDVRAAWLSRANGKATRTITYDGAAHNHDLFRDAALMPSGEIVVALRSSRCPEWLKPWRELQHRLKGGPDWRSIDRETNQVNDADPYNYDCVVWKSLQSSR